MIIDYYSHIYLFTPKSRAKSLLLRRETKMTANGCFLRKWTYSPFIVLADPDGIRGRCGLYNLGNTCFMNSGLQCLLSSVPLVRFLFNYTVTDQSVKSTLLGQFHELFEKVWSGRYSIIFPRDFKQTLGLYHPQFQDYRQVNVLTVFMLCEERL